MKKQVKYFILFLIILSNQTFVVANNYKFDELNSYNSFPKEPQTNCDTIYLLNGQKIIAQITNYSLFQIKYFDCNDLSAPATKISRSKVAKIVFANGETKIVSKNLPNSQNNINQKWWLQYDEFALVGFIVSLIPFYGSLLGLALSSIGLIRTMRNPKLKGRLLSIVGMGISLFYFSIFLFYILIMFILIFI